MNNNMVKPSEYYTQTYQEKIIKEILKKSLKINSTKL